MKSSKEKNAAIAARETVPPDAPAEGTPVGAEERQGQPGAAPPAPLEPPRQRGDAEGEVLLNRETALQERELALLAREESLSERERNAEKGFLKEQLAAAGRMSEELERLRGDILAAEEEKARQKRKILEELAQARHTAMMEQDRALEQRFADIQREQDERHEKLLRQLDAERDAGYKKMSEEIVQRRRALDDELEKRRAALEAAEREMQKRAADLAAKEKVQQVRELKSQAEEEAVKSFQAAWKEQVETECRERYEGQLRSCREDAERMRQYIQAQDEELSRLRQRELNCAGRSREQLQAEIDDLRKLLEEEKRRPTRELSEAERVYLEKGRLYDGLEKKKREQEARIRELSDQLQREEMARSDLNMAKTRSERLEIERNAMEQELDRCKETIRRLKIDYQRPEEEAARIKDITDVKVLKPGSADPQRHTEREWLERTRERCGESGFQLSSRLLYSFHTALKTAEWSPITVLAGVSGTGKSMLPKLYARFGGLYFLSLPVQPDWDSAQSLFGFFNAIDNRFNATNLLAAMVQMQDPGQADISDKMLLVLLDEMNLAHVELYFSELLSKLEERRGEAEGTVSVSIDLGSALPKYPVKLTRNVLWAGTMNEDETTKTLSDKVIDRSSMITFPRPTVFARREQPELAKESPLLPRGRWEEWLAAKRRFRDDEIQDMKAAAEAINNSLASTGRALGHRVWQSIEQYIANHPCVIESQEGKPLQRHMQMAFEEALVQKVMPKLRGIELTDAVRSKCLDPIQGELEKSAPGLLEDYQRAVFDDSGLFLWRSSRYLEESYD